MPDYDDSQTLREALAVYFEANGFGTDGGYTRKWVSGHFGPIPFAFPNTEARRRAVPLHDLHHVITGYDTDGVGEGAIGAWEVASGCEQHWVAWFLNMNAMWLGTLLDWRAVWTGFVRGRRSRNYYARSIDDQLLSTNLAVARRELLADDDVASPRAASGADRAAFAGWWCLGLALVTVQLGLIAAPLAWLGGWLLA